MQKKLEHPNLNSLLIMLLVKHVFLGGLVVGGVWLQKNNYVMSDIKSILNFPLNIHIKLKRHF